MMRTSLCMRTFPYLRMAVRAVTEMDSWTKPVMNHATQWTALFSPIIFITCKAQATHQPLSAVFRPKTLINCSSSEILSLRC